MTVIGKPIKTEMIASPEWMVHGADTDTFDDERQMYIALAIEQKFDAVIKSGDVSKLYEIVFHFLNINALVADRKLYDAHFREIRGNEQLTAFVDNLDADKNGQAARIISHINNIYTKILLKYTKFVINVASDVGILYFDKKNIHYRNLEIYVLFNVKPHENYELWKITFKTENKLGSEMEHLRNFEMKAGEINEFKEYVRSYNRKNPISRIRSGNFVAATCDTAKESKSIVSIIKDTILINKIFYEKNQFNPNVLSDINQIVVDKKTFPFKLLLH